MEKFSVLLSIPELEEHGDVVKQIVLENLVNEGLLEESVADQWCETHTVIVRKKSFFRTISDKWRKTKETAGAIHYIIVKRS